MSFVCSDKRQEFFRRIIKCILVFSLSLMHFRSDQPLLLALDASGVRLGAFLFHCLGNWAEKVIANALKPFTPAERNCSQIEREALSIVFKINISICEEFTVLFNHQLQRTISSSSVPLLVAIHITAIGIVPHKLCTPYSLLFHKILQVFRCPFKTAKKVR